MTVKCTFDSHSDVTRNGNILQIENSSNPKVVVVRILDKEGHIENESVVDGMDLIRAVQNAVNYS